MIILKELREEYIQNPDQFVMTPEEMIFGTAKNVETAHFPETQVKKASP